MNLLSSLRRILCRMQEKWKIYIFCISKTLYSRKIIKISKTCIRKKKLWKLVPTKILALKVYQIATMLQSFKLHLPKFKYYLRHPIFFKLIDFTLSQISEKWKQLLSIRCHQNTPYFKDTKQTQKISRYSENKINPDFPTALT